MRAAFHDVAVFHDEDHVGIADRGEAVRDDETRAPFGELVHRRLDQFLGARVDRTRRLVEDQDRRILHHRARDRQQLLLALRQRGRLVEHGVVALGQRHDVAVQPHGFARRDDLLVAHAFLRIHDVLAHGALEHPSVLQHHRELVMYVPARHVLGVDAVNRDLAAIDFIEPHQ